MNQLLAAGAALVIAFASAHAPPAAGAGGVVGTGSAASCTQVAFDDVFFNAQSTGGGVITFNCGAAPHAIVLGAAKLVGANTEIQGGNLLTLSGANASGLFQVGTTGTLKLVGLTLTRAFGPFGAIENFGRLTVTDSRIEINTSTVNGGGVTNHADMTLTNVVVAGNKATDFGGGLYTDGGTATITNSQFTDNASGKRSGAIDVATGAVATITSSRFAGNKSTDAGAIRSAGTLTIDGSTLAGNTVTESGGALYIASGTTTLSHSVLIFNLARKGGGIFHATGNLAVTQSMLILNGQDSDGPRPGESGGALHREGSGTATLTEVTLAGNVADNGGAITNISGTTTITNASISGNRAALFGGAIDVVGGSMTLLNATITDNSADAKGGALSRRGGTLAVKNTALANPSTTNCAPALILPSFSLSSDNSCGFGAGRDNVPMAFDFPALNGGFVVTQLPSPGNPVIDNGTGIGCPATDARGVKRPSGLACDVGAVEMVAGAPATATAVEYYNAAFGHYFVTILLDEIVRLDSGSFVGWMRTGQQFNVYRNTGPSLAAVCRFFTVAFSPKSSHFYAPRGFGCEGTLANQDWQLEGDVFYTPLPSPDGSCPAGHLPIYRLYNAGQGGAPNHRFTTSNSIRMEMLARGYTAEGNGVGVGMCSPQ